MTKWYESENPGTVARGGAWRLGVWIVVIILFCMVVGALIWGIRVATSDVKGQGDAITTKNSGTNRIRAQEEFVQKYNDVVASDRRIDQMGSALAQNPDSQIAQTNLNGAINNCINLVGDYNALVEKYTSADFIPEGYPTQIDNLSPDTDCKETETR